MVIRSFVQPNFVHAYGHYICLLCADFDSERIWAAEILFISAVSAVQGHPRSLILVPIESTYANSY